MRRIRHTIYFKTNKDVGHFASIYPDYFSSSYLDNFYEPYPHVAVIYCTKDEWSDLKHALALKRMKLRPNVAIRKWCYVIEKEERIC